MSASHTGPQHTLALVGDIGGTTARLAIADLSGAHPAISNIRDYESGAFKSAYDVVRAFLSDTKISPGIAAIAAAGPITKGDVHFTNLGWSLSESGLRSVGFAHAGLLNDFEALALATKHFEKGDTREIGRAGEGDPDSTIAVIGPGTGFGASALVRGNGHAVAMATEGGHASFAPADEVEREILRILSFKFSHVSIERVLSGPGLQNLQAALDQIEGVSGEARSPSEITQDALAGDARSARTLGRFCAILGGVAGDFALYYGARGGVFVAGGIAPAIFSILEKSDFRRRFEAKGRFDAYLRPIPTRAIVHTHAAFLGAAERAREILSAGQSG